jgi:hypothetical protein
MTNCTAFVNVSDPLNPIFLGRLNSSSDNNYWRDVKVYNNQSIKSVQLHSLLGQKIIEEYNINSSEYVLNTERLQKGVYFIKVNKQISRKLIIK